jgi:hypothetical protein
MRAAPRFGKVVDEKGQPIEGAYVSVEWGTGPTPEITLVTGSDGGFRLGLPEGRFRIRARLPGHETGVVEVEGGPSEVEIMIRLGRDSESTS